MDEHQETNTIKYRNIPEKVAPLLVVILMLCVVTGIFLTPSKVPPKEDGNNKSDILRAGQCTWNIYTVDCNNYWFNNAQLSPKHLTFLREISLDLLVIVHSLPEHSSRRRAIRDSWGNRKSLLQLDFKVLLFFLVGNGGNATQLQAESRSYNDLIQFNATTFEDQTVAMLKWIHDRSPKLKLLLKVEDDTYVNLQLLSKLVLKFDLDKMEQGHFMLSPSYWFLNRQDPSTVLFERYRDRRYLLQIKSWPLPLLQQSGSNNNGTYLALGPLLMSETMVKYFCNLPLLPQHCETKSQSKLTNFFNFDSCNFYNNLYVTRLTPEIIVQAWKRKELMAKMCDSNDDE